MNTVFNTSLLIYTQLQKLLNLGQPIYLLSTRLYVSWVFFASGLTKIKDWDTTLWLFEEEYNVPLLNYHVAAFLGTAGELVLPIMLAFGLGARFAAVGLSIVNVLAVISLQEIAPAAHTLHILWGMLLLNISFFGAGFLSLDRLAKVIYKVAPTRK
ncbi:TPA: DoxX family protein [Vibrio vulnificus]|nr:DoxX family protein [Vibrio vulnificus]